MAETESKNKPTVSKSELINDVPEKPPTAKNKNINASNKPNVSLSKINDLFYNKDLED